MRITSTARRAAASARGAKRPSRHTAHTLAARSETNGPFSFFPGETLPMLRIALPNKGRLSDEARQLFGDAGLAVEASGARALTASLGGEFQALFVRAQDIPEFVADGAADAGVTGWDLVLESGRELCNVLDLAFGACRLVVAVTEDVPAR